MPEDHDPYTSEPTHLRIYREETGDEYVWHIDGADDEGKYTEDVRRFATFAECIMYADLFVHDSETDGVKWGWDLKRPRRPLREHPTDCLFCAAGEPMTHNYEPPTGD